MSFTLLLRTLLRLISVISKSLAQRKTRQEITIRSKASAFEKLKKAVRVRRHTRSQHHNVDRLHTDGYRRD